MTTGRYEFAILLSDSIEKTKSLLVTSVGLAFVTAITLLVCVTTCYFFNLTEGFLIFALPFWVFLLALASIFEKISNKEKNYGLISTQKVALSIAAAGISISVGWWGSKGFISSEFGLIAGAILGVALSVLIAFLVIRKKTNYFDIKLRELNVGKLIIVAKSYRQFPIFNLPHAIINTTAGNAPVFLIPIFFADALLGIYSLSVRIIQMPLGLLIASLYSVFSQKFFDVKQCGGSLSRLYKKYIKYIFFAIVLLLPIFWFLEIPIAYIFGEKWRDAGKYIRILSPYLLFVLMVGPFAFVPVLLGKQKQAFYLEVFASSTKIISLVIGGLAGDFDLMLILFSFSGFIIQLWTLNWYRKLLRSSDYE